MGRVVPGGGGCAEDGHGRKKHTYMRMDVVESEQGQGCL